MAKKPDDSTLVSNQPDNNAPPVKPPSNPNPDISDQPDVEPIVNLPPPPQQQTNSNPSPTQSNAPPSSDFPDKTSRALVITVTSSAAIDVSPTISTETLESTFTRLSTNPIPPVIATPSSKSITLKSTSIPFLGPSVTNPFVDSEFPSSTFLGTPVSVASPNSHSGPGLNLSPSTIFAIVIIPLILIVLCIIGPVAYRSRKNRDTKFASLFRPKTMRSRMTRKNSNMTRTTAHSGRQNYVNATSDYARQVLEKSSQRPVSGYYDVNTPTPPVIDNYGYNVPAPPARAATVVDFPADPPVEQEGFVTYYSNNNDFTPINQYQNSLTQPQFYPEIGNFNNHQQLQRPPF
ncbi:hypothetical protein HK099_000208 [Clydaea vesicula]|uniref:Uncharacterized protein n=1 Tax=Clydaea vesicula TaxID=447962 RepID=A0AAD5XVM1_9FUNG|nr:hypothetical protein HK099_000208 [Clydaea vesicula]KAJ3379155.1 hypothetical protein HDU92_006859 [Lobulomyces angularis]